MAIQPQRLGSTVAYTVKHRLSFTTHFYKRLKQRLYEGVFWHGPDGSSGSGPEMDERQTIYYELGVALPSQGDKGWTAHCTVYRASEAYVGVTELPTKYHSKIIQSNIGKQIF